MDNTHPGLDTKHFEPVGCAQKDYRCKVCKTYFDPKCPNCNPPQSELAESRQDVNDVYEDYQDAVKRLNDYCDMWDQAHLALTIAGVQSSEDGVLLSLETRIDKLRKERDKYKQIVILRSGQRKSTT